MPWQEDKSQTVVGSILCAGKGFYFMISLFKFNLTVEIVLYKSVICVMY